MLRLYHRRFTDAEAVDAGRACAAGGHLRNIGRNVDVDALAEAEVVDELDAVEVDVDAQPPPTWLAVDDTDDAAADDG